MADRTPRRTVAVAGVLLGLSIGAVVIAAAAASQNAPTSHPEAQAVAVDGEPVVEVTAAMNVASADLQAIITLEVDQAHITGLVHCRPTSLAPSSPAGPLPPEFTCATTSAFSSTSLAALERLGHVTAVWGLNPHRGTGLYFLGVHRGQPAIIVQTPSRLVRRDLSVIRALSGVLHCQWGPGALGDESTIACSTGSYRSALDAKASLRRLGPAGAEAFAHW